MLLVVAFEGKIGSLLLTMGLRRWLWGLSSALSGPDPDWPARSVYMVLLSPSFLPVLPRCFELAGWRLEKSFF